MVLNILIIGDSHIPDRAKKIPDEVIRCLKQLTSEFEHNAFDYIFFTGDLVSWDVADWLKTLVIPSKSISNNLFIVKGNMDHFYTENERKDFNRLQEHAVTLKINNCKMKIGLIHGHSIRPRGDIKKLDQIAQKMGVNILCSGHTHANSEFLTINNRLLLNPGSSVGAWSFLADRIPSFMHMILDVDQSKSDPNLRITVKLYMLNKKDGINKKEFDISSSYFQYRNEKITAITDQF
jgi:putative phosphoesterase